MPGGQATGDVVEDPDPVLYEPEQSGVPDEPVAVRHATAPNDRAQRQHDAAHVVAAADAQPRAQGHGRAAHVPRPSRGHGRMHGNADQARRGPGQRAGQAVTQPPGVLAVTVVRRGRGPSSSCRRRNNGRRGGDRIARAVNQVNSVAGIFPIQKARAFLGSRVIPLTELVKLSFSFFSSFISSLASSPDRPTDRPSQSHTPRAPETSHRTFT